MTHSQDKKGRSDPKRMWVQKRQTLERVGLYLRGSIGAALWRLADGRVWILHPVFDTGSFVHLYIGDGEDALAVGT